MRKEDRVRLPPPLELELPKGFKVERRPGGYSVFYRYRVGKGWGVWYYLVCAVDLGEVPDVGAWIAGQVDEVSKKLNSPQGWRGIHRASLSPGEIRRVSG